MMKWSHSLIAGSAIILLTNAVALGGAGYNRSGEPESQLQLTQRELQHSSWREGRDSSGITLTLNWRIEQADFNDSNFAMYSNRWGIPGWLDRGKMAELGFDVDKANKTVGHGLANMQTRVQNVGGDVDITSTPGSGTSILAWVPRLPAEPMP